MSEDRIKPDKIRRLLVDHRNGQVMQPAYRGIEIGADDNTEFKGFLQDYKSALLEPALQKFPAGATPREFSDFLHGQVDRLPVDFSAGRYLRASVAEIDDVLKEQHGLQRNEITVSKFMMTSADPLDAAPATQALDGLRKKHENDGEAMEMLDEAQRQLPPKATARDLARTLEKIGDGYSDRGDDFLAETADIMRGQIRDALAKPAIPAQAAPAAVRAAAPQARPFRPS